MDSLEGEGRLGHGPRLGRDGIGSVRGAEFGRRAQLWATRGDPGCMWTRRQWLGGAAGALGAAAGCGHGGLSSLLRGAGQVSLWLADAGLGRGPEGGALVGLDRAGFVVRVLRLPMPLAVASRAGRLWVSCALRGTRRGPWGLLELGPWGELLEQRSLLSGARFALDGEGEPWILSPGPGMQRLEGPDGRVVLTGEQLLGLTGDGQGVALASRSGELFRVGPTGIQQAIVDASILGLSAGAHGLRWIGRRLDGRAVLGTWDQPTGVLSDRLGRVLLNGASATDSVCLAAGPGPDLWIGSGARGELWRVAASGQLRVSSDCEEPPLKLLGDGRGGVWVVLPGALARVDRQGRLAPGQGGFGNCRDLTQAGS